VSQRSLDGGSFSIGTFVTGFSAAQPQQSHQKNVSERHWIGQRQDGERVTLGHRNYRRSI
jgi:hypothetical protein